MKKISGFIVATFILVTGCDAQKADQKETIQTIKFYKEHKEICEQRVKECKLMETMSELVMQDCANASKAHAREQSTKRYDWK